ncbi:ABC transporter related protein [Spirochaeta thermophila DSM 6578]|uniref:ABC transporter related protein n=1 Tax=Winmispira thermophila (strain ATCC 700085 / DSM 6578 / Z-1203) TaxID=869211 RepID=G0GDS7_WINT7|nr:ABC transporter ATP-binding protein [Spirochaeta thermophila]AEJ62207.1 ABC transporter related protein [Spirochaeta thermophila DSM 6578]
MLKVEGLRVNYDAIEALHGISFEVREGEIVTLIGANGAGKSTTLNAICGLVPVSRGGITFMGEDLVGLSPHGIVQRGISQVPEGRRVFANLTVEDNLLMGAYTRKDAKAVRRDMEQVYERFPRLKERYRQLAGTLSGGEQQMLALGRALMSRPRLLLMDEPSMGLAPLLVREIFSIIQDLNREGVTILLVEQNAHMALKIAHRGYVLETGNIILSGTVAELLENEEVKRAYLGG